ncbi:hypothetical protein FDP41_002694 [Naegleria fowleri]|uniref:Uncharacterized protein n=1 Tax=Naegleria fowleri TaxID=5763 RepID=A0A6A5BZ05_NAEFO|nr:uncharacterized protein FDP41_002694 [Naegleria fowleri]KAF0978179.1 hypothetical protein FDP41_002694 [Naegleria fowleri]
MFSLNSAATSASSLTSSRNKQAIPSLGSLANSQGNVMTTGASFSNDHHHHVMNGEDKKKFISRYQHTRHNIKQTNKQNNLEEMQKKKMSLEVLQSGFKKMSSNTKSSMYNQVMDEINDEDLMNIHPVSTTAVSSGNSNAIPPPTWHSHRQPPYSSRLNNNPISSNRERSRRFLQSLDIFNEHAEQFSSINTMDVLAPIQDKVEEFQEHDDEEIQSSITDLDEQELENEIASLDQQLYGLNTLINNDSFKNDEPQLDKPYYNHEIESQHTPNPQPQQYHNSPLKLHAESHFQENHHPSPYKEEKENLSKLDRLKELIEYKKELDRREVLIERLILGLRRENQMHRYKLKEVEKFCNEFSWSQGNLLEDIKRNLFSDSGITLQSYDGDQKQHSSQ